MGRWPILPSPSKSLPEASSALSFATAACKAQKTTSDTTSYVPAQSTRAPTRSCTRQIPSERRTGASCAALQSQRKKDDTKRARMQTALASPHHRQRPAVLARCGRHSAMRSTATATNEQSTHTRSHTRAHVPGFQTCHPSCRTSSKPFSCEQR